MLDVDGMFILKSSLNVGEEGGMGAGASLSLRESPLNAARLYKGCAHGRSVIELRVPGALPNGSGMGIRTGDG